MDIPALDELKDLPNLEDAGYGDLVVPGGCFRGICAPQGTPDNVKEYLADVIEKAYNSDDFQNYMKEQGLLDAYSKLGDFEKYNQEMVDTMKPIIQATGLAKGEYAE